MAEFREVINNMSRMCDSFSGCSKCPISSFKLETCGVTMKRFPEEAEEIIMKWAKENPAKPIKTNRDKFKEVFGVEVIDDDGSLCNDSCVRGKYASCSTCEYNNFWNKEYIERNDK